MKNQSTQWSAHRPAGGRVAVAMDAEVFVYAGEIRYIRFHYLRNMARSWVYVLDGIPCASSSGRGTWSVVDQELSSNAADAWCSLPRVDPSVTSIPRESKGELKCLPLYYPRRIIPLDVLPPHHIDRNELASLSNNHIGGRYVVCVATSII